jgi:hypothetical protein
VENIPEKVQKSLRKKTKKDLKNENNNEMTSLSPSSCGSLGILVIINPG